VIFTPVAKNRWFGNPYGLDMTAEMLALANENKRSLGFINVGVLEGEIEHIPLPDASFDVVISNCVINLSADTCAIYPPVSKPTTRIFRRSFSNSGLDSRWWELAACRAGDVTICQRLQHAN
jgi:hypothetical protein